MHSEALFYGHIMHLQGFLHALKFCKDSVCWNLSPSDYFAKESIWRFLKVLLVRLKVDWTNSCWSEKPFWIPAWAFRSAGAITFSKRLTEAYPKNRQIDCGIVNVLDHVQFSCFVHVSSTFEIKLIESACFDHRVYCTALSTWVWGAFPSSLELNWIIRSISVVQILKKWWVMGGS